jgi:spoIIIJ-associated protein
VERAPVYDEPSAKREVYDEPPAVQAVTTGTPERFEPPVRRESRERPARDYPREPRSVEFDGPGLSTDELIAQSTRLTEDFLKAMGFEAKVSATVDGNHVDVTAEVATDEELLTGRKGEVRQALQHLLNRILNRGEISRYHLQLEINDFWKRREEELRGLARSLADEAVAAGGEVMTEYLNAQERRIVHVTLREDARVKTYALGTDMIKRVAIAPADFEGGPRDERD